MLSSPCGDMMVSFCPRDILSTNFTSGVAVAMALKHIGQLLATESNFFDK